MAAEREVIAPKGRRRYVRRDRLVFLQPSSEWDWLRA
jgi:hypothetical protein